MITGKYNNKMLRLRDVIDLIPYGVNVRVFNSYDGKVFIKSCTKVYPDQSKIKKNGVDSKFMKSHYVRYGNLPVFGLKPTIQCNEDGISNTIYEYIDVYAYEEDINSAKDGEFSLTSEQISENNGIDINIFNEPTISLMDLLDVSNYSVCVNICERYTDKIKIKECRKIDYSKHREKNGRDKTYYDTGYYKYGNIMLTDLKPVVELKTSKYGEVKYLNITINASAYSKDIDDAKNGGYKLTDDQVIKK